MGVGIKVEISDSSLRARLARMATPRLTKVLDAIGQLVENQTKRRIQTEKESSEGKAWEDWSTGYAATRHGNHSLLQNLGHLQQSITHNVIAGVDVEVGTNVIYSAVHQFGYPPKNIPARPYLGVSKENEREIEKTVAAYLKRLGA